MFGAPRSQRRVHKHVDHEIWKTVHAHGNLSTQTSILNALYGVCLSVCLLCAIHSFSFHRIYTQFHTGTSMYLSDVFTLISPRCRDIGRATPHFGHVTYTSSLASYYQSGMSKSVTWPSGLRRRFKEPVSIEAWVRIPPLPIFVRLI
jgi:hypothetical protein